VPRGRRGRRLRDGGPGTCTEPRGRPGCTVRGSPGTGGRVVSEQSGRVRARSVSRGESRRGRRHPPCGFAAGGRRTEGRHAVPSERVTGSGAARIDRSAGVRPRSLERFSAPGVFSERSARGSTASWPAQSSTRERQSLALSPFGRKSTQRFPLAFSNLSRAVTSAVCRGRRPHSRRRRGSERQRRSRR